MKFKTVNSKKITKNKKTNKEVNYMYDEYFK